MIFPEEYESTIETMQQEIDALKAENKRLRSALEEIDREDWHAEPDSSDVHQGMFGRIAATTLRTGN